MTPSDALARHSSAELVGPCYDRAGLTFALGISESDLAARERAGAVLVCATDTGRRVYPRLQFDSRGQALPHLGELIALLAGPGGDRPWRVACWLGAPAPYLPGDISAARWLAERRDPTPVVAAARADAARWAQ